MTTRRFIKVSIGMFNRVYRMGKNVPVDTGNLKFNAIGIELLSKDEIRVFISGRPKSIERGVPNDMGIAPYVPFTNEPWISPRWHGKKNPNEGWFNRSVVKCVEYLAKRLGGEIVVGGGE